MAFLAYNFPLDQADKLTDTITRTTAGSTDGTVDAAARVIDLGLLPPAFNVNTTSVSPFAKMAVLVDWTTCDVADGDEVYTCELQGSNSTAFTNAYRLGVMQLGNGNLIGYPGASFDTMPNGRRVFYCDNWIQATEGGATAAANAFHYCTARYVRFRLTAAGTTPSVTILGAWLIKQ